MLGTLVRIRAVLEDNVIEPAENQYMIASAVSVLIKTAMLAFMVAAFYKGIEDK